MARRSQRISHPSAQHKRVASGSGPADSKTKRPRQAPKAADVTPTKSQYFQGADSQHHDTDEDRADSHSDAPESSDVDVDDGKSTSEESPDDEDFDIEDEDTANGRYAKNRKSAASARKKIGAGWKPESTTGFEPGVEVIQKRPKARPAGKVAYANETIHPNTLLFLKDLKANNRREWLKMNDPEFRQAEKDFHSFVEAMTEKLTGIDDSIPELPVKDVSPYFSVAWSRAGRKSNYAHYYVQIAPGNSLIGGGLWSPEAASTRAMRRAIDRQPRRLKSVLLHDNIRREFLSGAAQSEKAVVEEFVRSNAENALKTRPKDYDGDHPDIALLRLKNYTMVRRLNDDEVLGESGFRRIAQLMETLAPWITYCNSVVMPDEASENETDEDEAEHEREDDNEDEDE
ncbi:uncharacterized protein MYCFIDRAFT_148519 [Pseudocercospora fijiensis CIRAD86]|uniref:DUF2461 domain-containing protein n=1 Tax=Pseudocercospora fijiensis (strain CIRAD86) TaxID=383855 RepID=N1Q6E9_PSEFD|nr:uncharacterized protein MYCFIDRAFT_148519 [Pseudocercospora fijiensis CIRAD86]EME87899.1 hypothetical protein MYCFIDRAFT_148519 [Pseudocercospora fijiensis CIRAD86]